MDPDGKLHVPGAEEIVPVLQALSDHARRKGIRVVASADDHVPGHRELSTTPDFLTTFPEHCMRGTPGQRKIGETALRDPLVIEPDADPGIGARVRAHRGDILFHKHWFDVFTNANVPGVLEVLRPERIVLYGVATDVCDKYAIEGLRKAYPGAELLFVTDAARAIHAEAVPSLLESWKKLGAKLTTSDKVLNG